MERIVLNNIYKQFKKSPPAKTFLSRIISADFFSRSKEEFLALKDISLKATAGEIIGIIGPNGSGKTSLLSVIAGIYKADKGGIKIKGNVISLINLYVGQQQILTMKDNIYLWASLFGLYKAEIKREFDNIVKFAELDDFVNTRIHKFSRGMIERLIFSIGIHCRPEILLLDEVFEVGDEYFKRKSVAKIKELANQGSSILVATHDLDIVNKYCQRVICLDKGEIKKEGLPQEIIR